jgi:hypothetical protein
MQTSKDYLQLSIKYSIITILIRLKEICLNIDENTVSKLCKLLDDKNIKNNNDILNYINNLDYSNTLNKSLTFYKLGSTSLKRETIYSNKNIDNNINLIKRNNYCSFMHSNDKTFVDFFKSKLDFINTLGPYLKTVIFELFIPVNNTIKEEFKIANLLDNLIVINKHIKMDSLKKCKLDIRRMRRLAINTSVKFSNINKLGNSANEHSYGLSKYLEQDIFNKNTNNDNIYSHFAADSYNIASTVDKTFELIDEIYYDIDYGHNLCSDIYVYIAYIIHNIVLKIIDICESTVEHPIINNTKLSEPLASPEPSAPPLDKDIDAQDILKYNSVLIKLIDVYYLYE